MECASFLEWLVTKSLVILFLFPLANRPGRSGIVLDLDGMEGIVQRVHPAWKATSSLVPKELLTGVYCCLLYDCLLIASCDCLFNSVSQDGGYAEYVILRREALLSVSKDLDPAEVAPLLCAGLTIFNALRNLHGLQKGDLVAVFGLGGDSCLLSVVLTHLIVL